MRAFVVLGLVLFHTKPRDWLGSRLRNELHCVECDVKPQLNQWINQSTELSSRHWAWSRGASRDQIWVVLVFVLQTWSCSYIAGSLQHDTIRDAILTCAQKPTWVSLIYRTEPTTKKWKTEKKLKSEKTYMLRSIGKQSGESVEYVSREEANGGCGGKDLQKRKVLKTVARCKNGRFNFCCC